MPAISPAPTVDNSAPVPSPVSIELARLADPVYRDFQSKLVPTVDPRRILGVRTPDLRRFARTFARTRTDEARAFLAEPAHELYEEMNLHGELIGLMAKTPQESFALLDAFLPHVDNWATCDLVKVPAFERDLPAVLEKIRSWAAAEGPDTEYTVRFGVVQLMGLFLGDAFEPGQLGIVAGIDRPEYYVNMARAWYFSMALAKRYEATVPLFEMPVLDAWTHNKAPQKACESRQVSPERKAYLKSLKVHGAHGRR